MGDVAVYSSEKREEIRKELVAAAKTDPRICSAAHLGSAAVGVQDRWSDIDLALCITQNADLDQVIGDWTIRLYHDYAAVANFDVWRGGILYRVFLLYDTLQVDLSFWPFAELRAVGPKFHLIFGAAREPTPAPIPDSNDLIGTAWLYALHVRSSIARSRFLQAEQMLSGMRENVLALVCKRYGVPSVQGRGLDDLPEQQKTQALESLALSLEPAELTRAFRVIVDTLLEEVRFSDLGLAERLEPPLNRLVNCLAVTSYECKASQ